MSGAGAPGPTGLYVHLPFCASRCSYCTFVVTTDRRLLPGYMEALHRELELGAVPPGRPLESLYLGGGTPSQVPPPMLAAFLERLRRTNPMLPGAEVTAEANPEDVDPALLDPLAAMGVTRLSMGVQSFVDEELAVLERRHHADRAQEAAALVLEDGRLDLNLDLMLAIPRQSPATLERSLDVVLNLRPHHVSVYLLEMDKPHRLRRLHARHPDSFPDQDTASGEYLRVHQVLTEAGYEHYEVSNFALPGHRARHNLRYWRRDPVHALGAAAHGQEGNRRWANLDTVGGYLDAVAGGSRPLAWETSLSPLEELAEAVMLGLRLAEGVPSATADEAAAALPRFARRLEEFEELGLAVRSGDRLRLTPRGWLVSNELFSELV